MASSPVTTVWSIGALLTWTTDFLKRKQIDDPRLSAELLLSHTLGCSRMSLYTQYERLPDEPQLTAFRVAVKQAGEHTPIAYIIGKQWFFSLEFAVTRDVLIPRPDTETLVENTIQRIRQTPGLETPIILDLCTGTGCIAIALAKSLPTAQFVAVDFSAAALQVAQKNVQSLGVSDRITCAQGDLFEALSTVTPPRLFHAIVSNPPYIPTAQIAGLPANVRDYEPRMALDGGLDGLDFHRRIVADAKNHLAPGGIIALEIAFDQSVEAQAILAAGGYLENIRLVRDAAGQPRCVTASVAAV